MKVKDKPIRVFSMLISIILTFSMLVSVASAEPVDTLTLDFAEGTSEDTISVPMSVDQSSVQSYSITYDGNGVASDAVSDDSNGTASDAAPDDSNGTASDAAPGDSNSANHDTAPDDSNADESTGTPTASPEAGAVEKGTEVTLSTTTSDGTIYYTTDGTYPTTSSNVYSDAITINEAMTIKAITVKEGYEDSQVASFSFTLVTPTATDDVNGETDTVPTDSGIDCKDNMEVVNSDSAMDRQDISLLKNYYLELIRKGDLQGEISDVNLDGELDMQDYMIIKMSYLGI